MMKEESTREKDPEGYIVRKMKKEEERSREEEKKRSEEEKLKSFRETIDMAVLGIRSVAKPKKTNSKPKEKICQRCFNLKYHAKVVPIKVPMDSFREKLSNLGKMKDNIIVFKMVDIFDFHASFIENFRDIIGNNTVFLIVNKMDLLPKDISRERVKDWIRSEAKERGLSRIQGVHLASSKSYSIQSLVKELDNIAEDQEVFILGASNVGKSTLMNQIMKFHDINAKETTTSLVPGTTLNTISFKVPSGPTVYDTPGMHNPHQLTSRLSPKELSIVVPQSRIKPQIWSLNAGNTIYLGGLARIDYIEGPPIYFTLFVSKKLPIHVTRTHNADKIYKKHLGTILFPPLKEEQGKLPGDIQPVTPLVKAATHTFEGNGFRKATVDIVISGLGWVAITGPGKFTIDTWVPPGIQVFERNPLLPFETPNENKRDLKINKHKNIRPNKKKLLEKAKTIDGQNQFKDEDNVHDEIKEEN
eukprot:TRINITY_DN7875_c0_g1_i2.p1 TRINITY_DN7875_c0_g1~~TRINITY_DN7875_c0_g1_i2.p1  ORF type:complete len:507 (-),score=101.39 TRINITY_DN7875_c0_g1_i2:70-1488(-)